MFSKVKSTYLENVREAKANLLTFCGCLVRFVMFKVPVIKNEAFVKKRAMSLIIYVSENYVDIESTKTSTYFFFIFFHLRR